MAQVAVAVEGAHRRNTDRRVDDEQEKHLVRVEIITGLLPAMILSGPVPSNESDRH
jgi:hypothetical protein